MTGALTIDVLADGASLGGPRTTNAAFGYLAMYGQVPQRRFADSSSSAWVAAPALAGWCADL